MNNKQDIGFNPKARIILQFGDQLKRELLLDIIAKVAAHVNRPGISFVS